MQFSRISTWNCKIEALKKCDVPGENRPTGASLIIE